MKILIIRHGDPDYALDSLTPRGFKEAEALAEWLGKRRIDHIYASPLGRAQRTAEPTAKVHGLKIETLDWLAEIPISVKPPYKEFGIDAEPNFCPWNMQPRFWTKQPDFYDSKDWSSNPLYKDGAVQKKMKEIDEGWYNLMLKWGYKRNGQIYDISSQADRSAVIALFCHLGLGNALISRITGAALPLVWQTLFLACSSVTTLYTEVYPPFHNQCHMRLVGLSDVSHLALAGLETSSSGLHSLLEE
ncbi:MAG: histidine phosphatase family protein [Clostridiales bacterium]|nr:histidine phosphatase family protein [Clostridiales bacterium]